MTDTSIIIINYNTFDLTCKCIGSVIAHTKGISYEIILVDNASTECDPGLFTERFPAVKLIQSPVNIGFAGGNNLGIKEASGKYILLLNSDTELKDNAVKSCADYLDAHPEAGVVSVKLVYPGGVIQQQCQRFPSIRLELMELLRLHKLLPADLRGRIMQSSFFDHRSFLRTEWLWGTFFMFPARILEQLSGQQLSQDHFMYCEDKEWCYEISKLGYEIHYWPQHEVIHHLGGSSKGSDAQEKRMRMILENEKKFIIAHYGKWKWKIIRLLKILKHSSNLNDREKHKELAALYRSL